MERLRTLPDELWRALDDAGLFHFVLPDNVGGHNVPLPEALRVYEALAEIDASTAWCVAIGAGTSALGSMMDSEAARESLWSPPLGVAVGTLTRNGKAVLHGDTFLVNGRWPFSSGCVGAGWYVANCAIYDGDEPRIDDAGNQVGVMLPVPMADCSIDETWDSPGLRGTGSHHVMIEDASVPVHHGFTLSSVAEPGTPLYGLPVLAMLDCYLAAIMTGLVRGAFTDLFKLFGARAGEKGGLEAFPATVALEVAELLAEARAWRALLFEAVDDLWRKARSADECGSHVPIDGFDLRLASKVTARRGPRIVSAIALLAGGRSLLEAPDLQRRLRDAHAIASHGQYATPQVAGLGLLAVRSLAGQDPTFP